ncbi:28S ribosomal protein S29, mitochondrial-like [Anneissia japonica]|uniref:28S ribosomal protein S29, mitochondrial-like n=1 Tax=Anneissia japonica TaxID=1529436 RepID=UPI0014259A99|nr:28S ribosomal protein S29, mitochondrial-like [Anneissia japonica]XP_033107092.1 28S ribosomal protein S29, mitochondrial-like [Anneissia japonica]
MKSTETTLIMRKIFNCAMVNARSWCSGVTFQSCRSMSFRSPEDNPAKQVFQHEGLLYKVPQDEVSKIFPVGYSRKWYTLSQIFRDANIMIRRPALEVIDYLKKSNFKQSAVRYVLYGNRGSGKTLSLMHIMHYCYTQGWMIVHIPNANDWNVNNRFDFLDSVSHEGMYDQPVFSAEWLKQFKSRNELSLSRLKTHEKYTWSKRECTDANQPLISVIDQGLNRPKNATDVIGVLLKELKEHSFSDSFKMLYAVKAVNGLFAERTNIRKPGGYMIPVRELTMCMHFRKFLNANWKNGAIVTTVDQHNSYKEMKADYKPLYLLKQEGFEVMDPFIPVKVDNYSEKEFESMMQYLLDKKWIQNEKICTESGMQELKFLSSLNPGAVQRICFSL